MVTLLFVDHPVRFIISFFIPSIKVMFCFYFWFKFICYPRARLEMKTWGCPSHRNWLFGQVQEFFTPTIPSNLYILTGRDIGPVCIENILLKLWYSCLSPAPDSLKSSRVRRCRVGFVKITNKNNMVWSAQRGGRCYLDATDICNDKIKASLQSASIAMRGKIDSLPKRVCLK